MFWKSKPCRTPVASSSDSSASTLMTCAPISLSWRTAVGPERARHRSITLMCDRARVSSGMVQNHVTNDRPTLDRGMRVGNLVQRHARADTRYEGTLFQGLRDLPGALLFGGLGHRIDQDPAHEHVLRHQSAKRHLWLGVAARGVTSDYAIGLDDLQADWQIAAEVNLDDAIHPCVAGETPDLGDD